MNKKKILLYFNTLKHLKPVQIYYRFYYLFRNILPAKNYTKNLKKELLFLNWNDIIQPENSCIATNNFLFLNISHRFKDEIDWNYNKYGKLWTYNLTYFDFINQKNISVNDALKLINSYVKNNALIKDGKEAYPISLRGINWIKFLSKNKISNKKINQSLYNDYQILIHNLEYHLLGNHLLENAFSLFFAAYYFNDPIFYLKSKHILRRQLKEQLLNDGAHFELTPMYHQILLNRLLDCIQLIQLNKNKDGTLLPFLKEKAIKMLSWLETITYKNGNIPMINDSAYAIASSSEQLFTYAKLLGLTWGKTILKESGYRKISNAAYELFIDVGDITANYQPGHTHSDIFNFELYIKNKPFIVDRGISTYEKNDLRNQERSTSSHNTVIVDNKEQTEVWGGFRVGKRAKVFNLTEKGNSISASHDGYKKNKIIHHREFKYLSNEIVILDKFSDNSNKIGQAIFHLHPIVKIESIKKNEITFINSKTNITFGKQFLKIEKMEYNYCTGFNKTKKAIRLVVHFKNQLITKIII